MRQLIRDTAPAGYPVEQLLEPFFRSIERREANSGAHLVLPLSLLRHWERLVIADIQQLPPVNHALVADARARMTQAQRALAKLRATVAGLEKSSTGHEVASD